MGRRSLAEEKFEEAWKASNGWAFETEYTFDGVRKWRFDFAWPDLLIALEVEGRGRHTRVVGVRKDCEKYNAAIQQGWRVLRVPATDHRFVDDWVRLVVDTATSPHIDWKKYRAAIRTQKH